MCKPLYESRPYVTVGSIEKEKALIPDWSSLSFNCRFVVALKQVLFFFVLASGLGNLQGFPSYPQSMFTYLVVLVPDTIYRKHSYLTQPLYSSSKIIM